jgi:uncharacterized membrane protein
MMDYVIVKRLHILSSTFLFGTGIGTAFYMLLASLSREPHVVYTVAKHVVIADWLFTMPSVLIQPITGFYLAHLADFPLTSRWIVWSTALYLLAGACWIPVVWMQIRMREMARCAVESGNELPLLYWRYFRVWVLLGIPAFLSLVVVFYLMVAQPV